MQLIKSRFHFVGVGGIGMCGLAELLCNMGAQVTGSDLSENANTERLKKLGVKIFKGHQAQNVGEVDVVVYSSAIPHSNPEILAAKAKSIPLIPRAEALAEIMRLKRGIAVAGTHGKTTTTSIIASVFLAAQSSPTIVVGGRFDMIQSTAHLGDGEWLIAEADESDGSFQKLSPELSVITNIDSDHLDYFKSFENLQKAFLNFANKIPFYGTIIACGDDLVIRQVLESFSKKVLYYGFSEKNDYVLKGEKGHYQIFKNTLNNQTLNNQSLELFANYQMQVPGVHNALNACAAFLVGMTAGFDIPTIQKGIQQFQGVDRRFQFKGEKVLQTGAAAIAVYDDYGHHPTEVRATLQAFKEKFPDRRIVVLFQPHRYSRTESCWSEFTSCFKDCDELLLTDIYPAGEPPVPGITSEKLCLDIKHSCKSFLGKNDNLVDNIKSHLKPNDVFVTLGAGDGWKIGMEILK